LCGSKSWREFSRSARGIVDMNGSHLGTKEITRFDTWKDMDGWEIEKTSWGYSLNNTTSEQSYSICFLNDEFEMISSMQTPNSLCSGAAMGSRYVVQWYDVTTWGYRVAITEPIVDENAGVTPEPDKPPVDEDDTLKPDKPPVEDDTSKPDKPSADEDSEDAVSPDTGDGSRLWLILLIMAISGGIVVKAKKLS